MYVRITLPALKVICKLLQVDLQTFLTGYYAMRDGQTQFGGTGSSVNVGNLLTAVFIATGQDVASVTECANGLLIVRPATLHEIQTCGNSGEQHYQSDKSRSGLENLACSVVHITPIPS